MLDVKGNPPRVLIVDDDAVNRMLLRAPLEREGYEVIEAEGGEAALIAAWEREPHLILLDILMEDIDGYGICLLLKSDSRTRNIPVMFITAVYDVADQVKGLSLGAVDYLIKPVNPRILLPKVHTFVTMRVQELENLQAEEVLRESEKRFRLMAENSPDIIARFEPHRGIRYINSAVEKITGFTTEEIVENHGLFLYMVHTEDQERYISSIESVLSGDVDQANVEFRMTTQQGDTVWLDARMIHLSGMPARGHEYLMTARDVTGRRRMEEELRSARTDLEKRVFARTIELTFAKEQLERDVEARQRAENAEKIIKEQLRFLTQRLLSVQEQERASLSRELHDEIGQMLSMLSTELVWLLKQQEVKKQHIDALLETVSEISTELRRICHGLHPMIITNLGLSAAVEALLKEYESLSVFEIEAKIGKIERDDVNGDVALNAYRILKECLTNAKRHSGASKVRVRLELDEGSMGLDFCDDGCGMDIDNAMNHSGVGLIGMRERAEGCGGTLTLESVLHEGTCVKLRIPLMQGEGQ